MSKEIYLISPATIKSLSNINDNVHDKFLVSAIKEAQDVNLQTAIGTSLLNKLKVLIESGEISEDENLKYKTLLDEYIKYYLIYQSISKIVPIISWKLDNIGTFVTGDEHAAQLSFKETQSVMDYYNQQASFYLKRLEDYLMAKKEEYPELATCEQYQIKPTLNSAEQYSNLFLGGKRGRRL